MSLVWHWQQRVVRSEIVLRYCLFCLCVRKGQGCKGSHRQIVPVPDKKAAEVIPKILAIVLMELIVKLLCCYIFLFLRGWE